MTASTSARLFTSGMDAYGQIELALQGLAGTRIGLAGDSWVDKRRNNDKGGRTRGVVCVHGNHSVDIDVSACGVTVRVVCVLAVKDRSWRVMANCVVFDVFHRV